MGGEPKTCEVSEGKYKQLGKDNVQWELRDLDKDVRKSLTKKATEELRVKMEERASTEIKKQEKQEIDTLWKNCEHLDKLKNNKERERFFGEIEMRLSVLLVMLIRSKVINYNEFKKKSVTEIINKVYSKKNVCKIKTSGGDRSLNYSEKMILEIVKKLPNHRLVEVKKEWEVLGSELLKNVTAMDFAAEMASAEMKGEKAEMPKGLDPKLQKTWEKIKDYWDKSPPLLKFLAMIGGAIMGFKAVKWIWANTIGKSSKSKEVAAWLAGGTLIAGGIFGFKNIWKKFRGILKGKYKLKELAFLAGLKSLLTGDLKGAKKSLGSAFDFLFKKIKGKKAKKDHVEKDEDGVEWMSVGSAWKYYARDLKRLMMPVTAFIKEHKEIVSVAAGIYGITHLNHISGGIKFSKNCLLGFAKLLSSGAKHPIRSLLIITAFISATHIKVPKDTKNLINFLKNKTNGLSKFLKDQNFIDIPDHHIDIVAAIMTGKKNLNDYADEAKKLTGEVIDGIASKAGENPKQKILRENLRGFDVFLSTLKMESYDKKDVKTNLLITKVEFMQERIKKQGKLFPKDIEELSPLALNAGIKFLIKDGYVWWGRVDKSGRYTEPDNLFCLCVDPGLSEEKEYKYAKHFTPNPRDKTSIVLHALKRPIDQVRSTAGDLYEAIKNKEDLTEKLKAGGYVILLKGTATLYDGVKKKYYELPGHLLKGITGNFHFKEFAFAYAEGLIPVTVFGMAKSVFALSNPFKGGVMKLVFESVTYPYTGTRDLFRAGGKYIVKPFCRGMQEGSGSGTRLIKGLREVASTPGIIVREEFSRWYTKLRYNMTIFNKVNKEALRRCVALRSALSEIRDADKFFTVTHRSKSFEKAREILVRAGVNNVLISEVDVKKSINTIYKAIKSEEGKMAGIFSSNKSSATKAATAAATSKPSVKPSAAKPKVKPPVKSKVTSKKISVKPERTKVGTTPVRSREALSKIKQNIFKQITDPDDLNKLKKLSLIETSDDEILKITKELNKKYPKLTTTVLESYSEEIMIQKMSKTLKISAAEYREIMAADKKVRAFLKIKCSHVLDTVKNPRLLLAKMGEKVKKYMKTGSVLVMLLNIYFLGSSENRIETSLYLATSIVAFGVVASSTELMIGIVSAVKGLPVPPQLQMVVGLIVGMGVVILGEKKFREIAEYIDRKIPKCPGRELAEGVLSITSGGVAYTLAEEVARLSGLSDVSPEDKMKFLQKKEWVWGPFARKWYLEKQHIHKAVDYDKQMDKQIKKARDDDNPILALLLKQSKIDNKRTHGKEAYKYSLGYNVLKNNIVFIAREVEKLKIEIHTEDITNVFSYWLQKEHLYNIQNLGMEENLSAAIRINKWINKTENDHEDEFKKYEKQLGKNKNTKPSRNIERYILAQNIKNWKKSVIHLQSKRKLFREHLEIFNENKWTAPVGTMDTKRASGLSLTTEGYLYIIGDKEKFEHQFEYDPDDPERKDETPAMRLKYIVHYMFSSPLLAFTRKKWNRRRIYHTYLEKLGRPKVEINQFFRQVRTDLEKYQNELKISPDEKDRVYRDEQVTKRLIANINQRYPVKMSEVQKKYFQGLSKNDYYIDTQIDSNKLSSIFSFSSSRIKNGFYLEQINPSGTMFNLLYLNDKLEIHSIYIEQRSFYLGTGAHIEYFDFPNGSAKAGQFMKQLASRKKIYRERKKEKQEKVLWEKAWKTKEPERKKARELAKQKEIMQTKESLKNNKERAFFVHEGEYRTMIDGKLFEIHLQQYKKAKYTISAVPKKKTHLVSGEGFKMEIDGKENIFYLHDVFGNKSYKEALLRPVKGEPEASIRKVMSVFKYQVIYQSTNYIILKSEKYTDYKNLIYETALNKYPKNSSPEQQRKFLEKLYNNLVLSNGKNALERVKKL